MVRWRASGFRTPDVLSPIQPAWSRQLRVLTSVPAESGRSYTASPGGDVGPRDAKTPACGQDVGGGIVAKRCPVMGLTRRRPAREQQRRNGPHGEGSARRYFQTGTNRPHREKTDTTRARQAGISVHPWDTKTS